MFSIISGDHARHMINKPSVPIVFIYQLKCDCKLYLDDCKSNKRIPFWLLGIISIAIPNLK